MAHTKKGRGRALALGAGKLERRHPLVKCDLEITSSNLDSQLAFESSLCDFCSAQGSRLGVVGNMLQESFVLVQWMTITSPCLIREA